MNYRHIYHAGNFADVLKHLTLVYVLAYLKRKDTAFRVIDTHAGIGSYDLARLEAAKTGEWKDGIGRLLMPDKPLSSALADDPTLTRYLDLVRDHAGRAHRSLSGSAGLPRYPGSPALIRSLLRAQDTLVVNEFHPEDAASLRRRFARDAQTKVLNLDGWVLPRSALPPKERRGVMLIDPPFEQPGEFERMSRAITDGTRRFSNGIFIFWYPIKDAEAVAAFRAAASTQSGDRYLDVELFVRAPHALPGLAGCGLLIINPPFQLPDWLENILPDLCSTLAQGDGASWTLTRALPA